MRQHSDMRSWIPLVLVLAVGPAACSDDSETPADQQVVIDSGPGDDLALETAPDGAPDAAPPDGANANRFAEAKEKKLQKALDDGVKNQGPPGGAMAARMGKKLWAGATGVSDLAKKTAMKPGDRMRIASITKTFVATLILLLDQEGLLSVEDKLSKWVPTFPKGGGIRLYHLLNHSSGVYNFTNSAKLDKTAAAKPEDMVKLATDEGPRFAPGAKWSYSNTNYVLLGMVAAKAAKSPWHVALRKRVLDKHGLKDTFAEGFETITGGMVKGYGLAGGAALKDVTNHIHPTVPGAAGCMVSTVADLTRFFNLLNEGSIISKASLKKMRETYKVTISAGNSYGLGLAISESGGQTFYCHDGSIDGFSSFACYWTGVGGSVAILFNATEAKSGANISEAFKALL